MTCRQEQLKVSTTKHYYSYDLSLTLKTISGYYSAVPISYLKLRFLEYYTPHRSFHHKKTFWSKLLKYRGEKLKNQSFIIDGVGFKLSSNHGPLRYRSTYHFIEVLILFKGVIFLVYQPNMKHCLRRVNPTISYLFSCKDFLIREN